MYFRSRIQRECRSRYAPNPILPKLWNATSPINLCFHPAFSTALPIMLSSCMYLPNAARPPICSISCLRKRLLFPTMQLSRRSWFMIVYLELELEGGVHSNEGTCEIYELEGRGYANLLEPYGSMVDQSDGGVREMWYSGRERCFRYPNIRVFDPYKLLISLKRCLLPHRFSGSF
jgi:hypothetical protein